MIESRRLMYYSENARSRLRCIVLFVRFLEGFIVASVGPIQVGIEIVDPTWALMCVALTSHAMRALGYLEADRPDLALAALKDTREVGDLAMMVRCDIPKMDSQDQSSPRN